MKRKPRKNRIKKRCEKNVERKRYCSLITGENGKRTKGRKMEKEDGKENQEKRNEGETERKKKLV